LHSFLRHQWVARLHNLNVEIIPYLRLFGADSDTVYMQHVLSEQPVICENTDTLILAYGHRSVISLHDDLYREFEDLHAVGDCLSPRTAEEAILEGLKIGALI